MKQNFLKKQQCKHINIVSTILLLCPEWQPIALAATILITIYF